MSKIIKNMIIMLISLKIYYMIKMMIIVKKIELINYVWISLLKGFSKRIIINKIYRNINNIYININNIYRNINKYNLNKINKINIK